MELSNIFIIYGLALMPVAMLERFLTGGWLSWRRYITIYPSMLFLCVFAWVSYPIRCMYDSEFAYLGLPFDDDDFDVLIKRMSIPKMIFDAIFAIISGGLVTFLFFGSFILKMFT